MRQYPRTSGNKGLGHSTGNPKTSKMVGLDLKRMKADDEALCPPAGLVTMAILTNVSSKLL
jgi:hypothetical protein